MKNDLLVAYIQSLEDLRRDNKARLFEAALHWNKLANDNFVELSRLLVTIISIVFPLSLIPLGQKEIVKLMSNPDKNILCVSWVLFLISLCLGGYYIYQQGMFFTNWSRQENDRSFQYSSGLFTSNPVTAFTRLNHMNDLSRVLMKMPDESNRTFFLLQVITALIGVSLLMIVFRNLIFAI